METSEPSCIVLSGEYEENVNPKSPCSANCCSSLKDSHVLHTNENGVCDNYAEIYSPTDSLSSSESVEMPCDIPDGPMYHDLAAYINSVVVASTNQSSNHMNSQSQLYVNTSDHVSDTSGIQSNPDIVSNTPSNKDTTDTSNVTQISQNDTNLSLCTPQQIDVVQNSVEQVGGGTCTEICEDDFADFMSDGPADENWARFTDETLDDVDQKADNAPNVINSGNFTEEDNDSEDFGDFTQFTPSTVTVPSTTMEIPSDCRLQNERQTSTPGILERLLLKLEPSLDKAFGQHFVNPDISEDPKSPPGSTETGLQSCLGEQSSSKEVRPSSIMLNHR